MSARKKHKIRAEVVQDLRRGLETFIETLREQIRDPHDLAVAIEEARNDFSSRIDHAETGLNPDGSSKPLLCA